MTMRRLAVPLSLLLVVIGAGVALAAGSGHAPTPLVRAHHYWGAGPSASYDGDSGGIGEVEPFRVAVPGSAASYAAVVTVSFDYRATGPGAFWLGLPVVEAGARPGDHGPPIEPVRPATRRLAATTWTSATAQFVVPRLDGGTSYDVRPSVNAAGGTNRIATRHVIVTIDLQPR